MLFSTAVLTCNWRMCSNYVAGVELWLLTKQLYPLSPKRPAFRADDQPHFRPIHKKLPHCSENPNYRFLKEMTAIHNHSSRQEFKRNDRTKNGRWKKTTKHTRKVKRKEIWVEAINSIASGSAALKELRSSWTDSRQGFGRRRCGLLLGNVPAFSRAPITNNLNHFKGDLSYIISTPLDNTRNPLLFFILPP